jgi:gas vesicle protein
MKAASLAEIKKQLHELPQPQLASLLLSVAKYKKENKELLTYLLFEASDEQQYIQTIKTDIQEQFETINYSNIYYTKKGIRKILRMVNKQIKFSGKSETTVDLLIYFLQQFQGLPIPIEKSTALQNLYDAQLKKIRKELTKLHEDMQYDYLKELDGL